MLRSDKLQKGCHAMEFLVALTKCRTSCREEGRSVFLWVRVILWEMMTLYPIKKEGRHPDDQSSNFKNLIP
jgi:hypothetical protein